jgi:hypothetical protein
VLVVDVTVEVDEAVDDCDWEPEVLVEELCVVVDVTVELCDEVEVV